MKHGRKLLAPLLALILLLALALPAAADYPARTEAMDLSEDWTGKTILLHTNDVHGAISGYAVAANMKLKLEKAGGWKTSRRLFFVSFLPQITQVPF